ncbi:MAG: hypothetical protein CSB44_00055 [Gammaproteobacteria bacterium]|nr:MAG: hypothetical protein CSB44_00055 [Gammaproteobacteria bacterium]
MYTALILNAALLAGFLYYLLFRDITALSAFAQLSAAGVPGLEPALSALSGSLAKPGWQDPSAGTFPSFIHAFMSLFALFAVTARGGISTRWRCLLPLFAVAALMALETTSSTVDPLDHLAVLMGAAMAWGFWKMHESPGQALRPSSAGSIIAERVHPTHRLRQPRRTMLTLSALACGSLWLATGSDDSYVRSCIHYDDDGLCREYVSYADPVYMSYTDLRNGAIRREAPRPPTEIGGVHRYGDYLLVNERNQGIHIIDNHDPLAPVNRAFLRIPGNTQVIVRGNHLYVDSFVDLVTLDFSDTDNIVESARQTDAFPWDAYQAVPYNIRFWQHNQPEPDLGVVVSYTE